MSRFVTSRALSLLTVSMPLLCCLALSTVARAQTDQAVYTDALVNGWQNWRLGDGESEQHLSGTIWHKLDQRQRGALLGALYLHQTAFDSTPYTALVFWINGASTGGQLLQVQATLNGASQTVVTLPVLTANT